MAKVKARLLPRRKALSIAIAGALALPAAAGAQDVVLEEIVVSSFRESLMDSMDIKKNSDSIVEAVTAEEIGKLPDISIAESIARLPGLTAQRLNGRGQVISVRGLSPDFTTALLNGREQVTTGDNRGVEFDQFPSELLSGVVVYKTPDAGLIGQGLAGTVDLRTVRPLQYGKQALAGNIRYEMTELDALNAGSADDGWRYSLSYVDQFADGTVGLALGFAHMSNPSQEERFNAWGYPGGPDDNLIIGGSKPYVRSSELKRDGIIGVLEFQPTDNFNAAIDMYYSEFEEDQQLRGIELPLWWSSAQFQPGYSSADGLVTEGTFANVRGVMRNDVTSRKSEVFSAGVNLEFAMGSEWTGEVDFGHSKVDRNDLILETYSGIPQSSGTADTLSFVWSDRGPVFTPTFDYGDASQVFLTSPQGWGGDVVPGGQLGYSNQPSIEDELNQIRLSAKRDVSFGPLTEMEIGVNYGKREKQLVADEFFLGLASGATAASIPNVTGLTDLGFLGIDGMVSYNPRELIKDGVYSLTRNPNGDVAIKSWQVEEEVTLGYVKFTIDTDLGNVPMTGNIGVQFVDTDQSSTAISASGGGSGVALVPTTGGTSYTDVLPSLNVTWDFGNDNYLRFAAARTMARPRMDEMRASRTYGYNPTLASSTDINASPWSAGGGNPELEPWIANAFDLSYEKYFAGRTGYFALAYFYKDLESYIYGQQVLQDFTGFIGPQPGEEPALNVGYSFAPANGKGGRINGVEAALSLTGEMLSDALAGFGTVLTFSWTDSNIKPNPGNPSQPLPGLSEEVGNFTVYYEKNGFTSRVSARYRSDFLGEVSGFGNGRNLTMVEGETVLDAQVGYNFSGRLEGLSMMVQGFNLSDEPFQTYYNDDTRQIRDHQVYGRSYMVGFSYRYR
ncbi:MAG: TonB-dependent receptor [Steroidobacteraceae bacterium]